jgi:hypothetical protein
MVHWVQSMMASHLTPSVCNKTLSAAWQRCIFWNCSFKSSPFTFSYKRGMNISLLMDQNKNVRLLDIPLLWQNVPVCEAPLNWCPPVPGNDKDDLLPAVFRHLSSIALTWDMNVFLFLSFLFFFFLETLLVTCGRKLDFLINNSEPVKNSDGLSSKNF